LINAGAGPPWFKRKYRMLKLKENVHPSTEFCKAPEYGMMMMMMMIKYTSYQKSSQRQS